MHRMKLSKAPLCPKEKAKSDKHYCHCQQHLNIWPPGGVRVHSAAAQCEEVPGWGGPRDGQHWAPGQGRPGHCGASQSSCCHLLSQPRDFVKINQLLAFFCANISSVPGGISQQVPIRSGTKGRSTTWRISRSRSTPAWLRPTVRTLIWGVRGGLV